MRGIKVGNKHTAKDWGLILNSKNIDPPAVKTHYIDVPGRDGTLDLTESLNGVISYDDRDVSFTFLNVDKTYTERCKLLRDILTEIHGKRLQIITDDEPDYYMIGRLTVEDIKNDASYLSLVIKGTCEPWKYALSETSIVTEVTGEPIEVTYNNNGARTLTPIFEISTESEITLTIDKNSHKLSNGTFRLNNFHLNPGSTTITINGIGKVTAKYTEGVL